MLLSIVVPTYNRLFQVSSLVSSFLSSSYSDFELIVVDDGSTDATTSQLGLIHDSRFQVIFTENGERGRARNLGARRAVGEYVCFFDSDDFPKSCYFEVVSETLKLCGRPDWLILGYDIQSEDGRLVKAHTVDANGHFLDVLQSGNPLSPDSIFLRRDLALAHPFIEDRDLAGSEDYELWIRLALSVNPVYKPESVICTVRQWPGRSVSNISPFKTRVQYRALSSALEALFWPQPLKYYKLRIYAGICMYFALQASFYFSSKPRSFWLLLKSLYFDPSLLRTRRPYAVLKHLLIS